MVQCISDTLVVLFNNMFEVKHKLDVCLEIVKSVYAAVQRIKVCLKIFGKVNI